MRLSNYLFPFWKGTKGWNGLLLSPPGFDVNFFIVGIDVIYASFRSNPVDSSFFGVQDAGGLVPGDHSGAQGSVFRQKRFAGALGQAAENRNDGRWEKKRGLHGRAIILFRSLFCQVS